MIEVTRTIRQSRATARRLEHREIGRSDLAEQIRWAFPANLNAHPNTPVTVSFTAEDPAVIELHAPVGVWWMPTTPAWSLQPRPRVGSASDAVAAAEATMAAHQRRKPG